MLSSKNITSLPSGNKYPTSKILSLGNHVVSLRGVELQKAGYDNNPNPDVTIVLSLEGPDQGPDFEGAPRDWDNPNKGNYKGQFAKVRIAPFYFSNKESKSGKQRDRDLETLRALTNLADTLDVRNELDQIEAETLEEYVAAANHVLCSSNTKLHVVIGGKKYFKEVDGEFKPRYERYLPIPQKGKKAYATEDMADLVETYDPDTHIYMSPKDLEIEARLKGGNVSEEKTDEDDVNWTPAV
jgi:hypothetical protein